MAFKELCILSLPRQGTDFLMRCLRCQGNYQREWFNPCRYANQSFEDILLPHFGSESQKEGLFSTPLEEEFKNVLKVWRGLNLNIAKEVWSFSKSKLFVRSMPTTYLFRKRQHTFPSSRPDFFMAIWESFLESNLGSDLLKEIKAYITSRCLSDPVEQQIVMHTMAWAIQFCSAPSQVIYYDRLMELSSDDLVLYLKGRMPEWIDISKVALNIEKNRIWNRAARESSYANFVSGSSAEKEVEMLVSFLSGVGLVVKFPKEFLQ